MPGSDELHPDLHQIIQTAFWTLQLPILRMKAYTVKYYLHLRRDREVKGLQEVDEGLAAVAESERVTALMPPSAPKKNNCRSNRGGH